MILFAALALLGDPVPPPPSVLPPPPASARELRREIANADGFSSLKNVAGARLEGTFVEGGSPGTIDVTISFTNGFSFERAKTGSIVATSGYDGASWQAQDGVLTIDDLPGDVADSLTSAWLSRDGQSDENDGTRVSAPERKTLNGATYDVATFVPAGGSPVELWFDAGTHLLARAISDTDGGALLTEYANYRLFGGTALALSEHDVDPTGAVSDTTLTNVTLLSSIPPGALDRTKPENRAHLTGPGDVAFRSDVDGSEGHVVVPASLDGKVLNVDFDSGGSNALIPEAAAKIGLGTSGGLEVGGVGNESEVARTARVAHLAIGSAVLDDQPFLVLPLPSAVVHPMAGLEIDGLVGFEMLANFRTSVDYGRHVLSFSRFEDPAVPGPGAVVLPFRSDGHTPYVEAEIDGVKGLFEIDTGANATVTIFDNFARAHGLFARGGVAYSSPGGVGGSVAEQVVRARSFALAGQTFSAPVVAVSKTTSGAFASHTIAGNIGSGILSRFTLTFDFRARTVTFEPRQNVAVSFPTDNTGLTVAATASGEIDVVAVAPSSPASEAGLQPGDKIVALDGEPAGAQSATKFNQLRGGLHPFTLTVQRGTARIVAELVPRDAIGAPQ